MKLKQFFPAFALVSWFCTVAGSRADITINYDFTTSLAVPDGGQLSIAPTLDGLPLLSSVNGTVARLNLTSTSSGNPMFLGDLYAGLTYGTSSETQRVAVLLNRPGVSDTDAFGSALSSLNITLDDSAATNVFGTTLSSGIYKADGRLSVNPYAAGVAFTSGSNGLAALNGSALTSNRVSLLIADTSLGGSATLSGWGISVTGVGASTGSFTPGANASISDGTGSTNTVGAALNTTGAATGGLILDLAGTTTFSSGVIGTGGLKKTGTGTLVLAGAGSYSGGTSVTSGKLVLSDSSAAGTGAISLTGSTSVLQSASGITVANDITLSDAGAKVDRVLTVGQAYTTGTTKALMSSFAGGKPDTTAQLLAGTSSGGIFSMSFSDISVASNDAIRRSDVFTTSGTGSDAYVLQLATIGTSLEADSVLGWMDTNNAWVNAVTGNSGGTATYYAKSFNDFLNGASFNATTMLGAYGYDSTVGSLWAVVNHGGSFTAVPEPTSALAGLLITAGLLRRRRSVA